MSHPQEPEPELTDWESKPVPWPLRIQRFKDGCRYPALLAAMAYLLVNLLRATEVYAQHKMPFLIFDAPLPTSQIRALLDFDQAWKVSIGSTILLSILALPRWQAFLSLAVVFLWEFVIEPVMRM
ncbi:MAG TPA: hypothetical protein PLD20_02705 [Blastocatellia bacterium]|nr:hypothetical protein [Blastocatellia bacterium]HMX24940.1 hypothetical protein [Blastocatellia bacterium]HMY75565.1 hypothetical protein [Blastocatellia bacterium]HMZ16848.1 hypothetical protein [Blastocatellia bacterium]HNG29152.1 hypothetical protein [Blastocatellia bacterium]